MFNILVINPGSTSTKIAVYEDEKKLFEETLRHSSEELEPFNKITDQYEFRKNIIVKCLEKNDFDMKTLSAVVGRGGLLKPIPSGVYEINDVMIEDLKNAQMGEHASNLGAIIANAVAHAFDIPGYIADPVVVDEMEPLARYAGHPKFERLSIFHALNQKAIARVAAKKIGKKYEELNLIVAHLGGGISVGAHKKGKVIDVNNALNGDGPFSPERSGGLPVQQIIEMCFSGDFSKKEIGKMVKGNGGCVAYLGTNDGREIEENMLKGDKKSLEVMEAMAYQISKEIGSLAAVLEGNIDGIVLTGGLAYDKMFMDWIEQRVSFLGEILIFPGEDELFALAQAGLRVLKKETTAKTYNG